MGEDVTARRTMESVGGVRGGGGYHSWLNDIGGEERAKRVDLLGPD